MKKIKPVTWVILLLAVLLIGAATYLAVDLIGRSNPNRYVTLGQYQNLSVTVDTEQPTQKGEQDYLQQAIHKLTPPQTVNDGAKSGDTVVFDFTGSENNQPIENFAGQNASVVLGKDEFVVSGLDQHLLGVKPNQSLTVSLAVPQDHLFEDLAGKTVQVAITIKDVTRSLGAELTQQWVTENTNYDSVAEFTAAMKTEYEQEVVDMNAATVRNTLWNAVIDGCEVIKYPANRLGKMQKEYRAKIQKGADQYEMEFIDYASLTLGVSTMEEYEEYELTYNQEMLKQELVIEAICQKEKISLSEAEYQQYMQEYTDLFAVEGFTQEDMIDYYGGEELLRQQFLMEKITDLIEQTATVTTE